MGKTKKRGYICYPGLMHVYGLPYPPKTESVALGIQTVCTISISK